ncbi:hypothetical protein DEO72_LG1g2400 [Vigna unguiculata]|uniref:Uncharacterized protein n=1 Tax=Vigna unguiculata TaxID=3917 RepID=A0A4D6KY60_VIGUN|nr:hypothetical protein DEO72_LG1g2400 [Vigna unguiculata]
MYKTLRSALNLEFLATFRKVCPCLELQPLFTSARVPFVCHSENNRVHRRFRLFLGPSLELLYSKVPRRSSVSSFPVARPVNLAQASQSRLGEMKQGACNSLGSLGDTSGVALQWSGRNSMAPASGCSWWCPICITRIEQLRVEQGYPPQVQASAESDRVIRIRMSRVES